MEGQAKGDVGPPRAAEPEPELELESSADEDEEKRVRTLIWKIDLHILPFVVLLYLFSFLDRGECFSLDSRRINTDSHLTVNIGNARLYGLEEDLGLVGDQYQIAVSILFVTYCVCRPFPGRWSLAKAENSSSRFPRIWSSRN